MLFRLSFILSVIYVNHTSAVHRITPYIRHNSSRGLFLSIDSPIFPYAYADADWAGSLTLDALPLVGTFSCESSLFNGNVRDKIRYLNLQPKLSINLCLQLVMRSNGCDDFLMSWLFSSPPTLYEENTSIASNPLFHERARSVEVHCHFLRDCFLGGQSLHLILLLKNKQLISLQNLFMLVITILLANWDCNPHQFYTRLIVFWFIQ